MINKNIYDQWNNKKKNITQNNILFRERDIWWCKLGKNIGQEQDGVGENFSRPVIVLRRLDDGTCIVLPLTTKENKGSWFFELSKYEGKKSWVMLNQIRLISVDRLYLYINYVDINEFNKIKKHLASLLKLF
jgi:mRNA interferase MazF